MNKDHINISLISKSDLILKSVNKKKRRVGRGIGSGKGKHSGRGMNGQKARSGCSVPALFEGGQNPVYLRLRKYGFTRVI